MKSITWRKVFAPNYRFRGSVKNMKYSDLRDFLAQLEKQNELKQVVSSVSPHLEMTEISDRVLRQRANTTVQQPEWSIRFE